MSLRRTKDLKDFTIAATDADIGSVHDLYFDDETWTIRYIVVETGDILSGHKVLISPLALRKPALRALHIWVNLTWKQVDTSPSFDLHKPVSRRHEIEVSRPLRMALLLGGHWGLGFAISPARPG